LLDQWGCEARKIPAAGDVFSLDFYLYRTNRELTQSLDTIISPVVQHHPIYGIVS
jgi:hypothetical protein